MDSLDPAMLCDPLSAEPVALRRLARASLLWSATPQAAATALDHAVTAATRDAVAEGGSRGWADRYGGAGIATNGGAGRAAVFRDRYLKGIGRTPLLGEGALSQSSDGHLFLEEAVRECVLGSILMVETPWGGIPPLAVLDTGLRPRLAHRSTPGSVDIPVVMVRETVLRPAHFERAPLFRNGDPLCGMADEARVDHNIARAVASIGTAGFVAAYAEMWCRWSEQFAYQLVHRISQSLPASSNVAWDGRLLDFGAARAVPSWAVHVPGPGLTPFGYEFSEILSFLRGGGADVLRRVVPAAALRDRLQHIETECVRRYTHMLLVELLRLLGFRRVVAERWLADARNHAAADAALRGILDGERRRHRYDVRWPPDEWRWLLTAFWSADPPRVLRPLRALCETIPAHDEPVRARARFRMRPRPDLNYDRIRDDVRRCFAAPGPAGLRARFEGFVAARIAHNRRDARPEPAHAVPSGFALAAHRSFAIFTRRDGRRFASAEHDADGQRIAAPVPVGVAALDATRLALDDGSAFELTALALDDRHAA